MPTMTSYQNEKNLATSQDSLDENNSTARKSNDVKIEKEMTFKEYIALHPNATVAPAILPDSDDDSIASSAQSTGSCCQVKQLEEQLLQLWTDKMAPTCCKNNVCEENEMLQLKLEKQEETISILKSTISAQIEIIAKQVEENLQMKTVFDHHHLQMKMAADSVPYMKIKPTPTNSCSIKVEPKPIVQDVRSSMRAKEQKEIDDMVSIVEQLSKKYSPKFARYNSKNFINSSNSSKKRKKPSIVPKCFYTMWKLLLAPPPPLVFVKDPKPRVNWSRLRP